jgi:hypothetical protein
MKVQIEGNLYLESDEMQFTLKEYTDKLDKNGKEVFKVLGYYGTIQQAAKAFVRMKIKQTTAVRLGELINDVNRIERNIESKLSV